MLGRSLARLRSAATASAAAAAVVSARSVAMSFAEPAAAQEPHVEKSKQCLQLNLLPSSTTVVLDNYKALYERVVADRVLIRPCITELFASVPLRALAIVEDGSTQSLLVVPSEKLWTGPPDLSGSSSDSVGYPVLPISIGEEQIPQSPLRPPPPDDAASTSAAKPTPSTLPPPAPPGAAAPAAVAPGSEASEPAAASTGSTEEEREVPTLWEQVELPWQLLERAGVLVIERDADAMPLSVSLATGGIAWSGELPAGGQNPGVHPRTVTVRLIDAAASDKLALHAKSEVPECGFCRFMKNGPCGDVFIAWEACVDAAKDAGEDFVERCGKATLALKACTDQHPEYYGEL